MIYLGRIWDCGDDLYLVMPPEVLIELGARVGDDVIWAVEDGKVTIRKADPATPTALKS
jgi:bifunctional DNA-binding transcriptional regulator/antitoxin component of YhaV-PrlF toxin-antitoxin module